MTCYECVHYPDSCIYERMEGDFLVPAYEGNLCLICKNYEVQKQESVSGE